MMPQFEPCNKYYDMFALKDLWRKDRYDAFVKDFKCVAAGYSHALYVTDSSSYLARFLAEVGKAPRRRRSDVYSFSRYFDKYRMLFDHTVIFKTEKGVHIIVSMPYGTQDQILNAYQAMKKEYRELSPVDMFFIDNRYKYRKNGDHMLMFVWWPLGMMENFPRKMMSRTIACPPDQWSNTTNKEESTHD